MDAPAPIECPDAADFIARLDPSGSLWSPFEYGRWIYRGHADASWDLTPKALRRGQRLSFTDPAILGPLNGDLQREAEWFRLAESQALADERGFQLPGDLSTFRLPWVQHDGWIQLATLRAGRRAVSWNLRP
jgi:hypothetical protein